VYTRPKTQWQPGKPRETDRTEARTAFPRYVWVGAPGWNCGGSARWLQDGQKHIVFLCLGWILQLHRTRNYLPFPRAPSLKNARRETLYFFEFE
jgi:hypothetical protein